MSSNLRKPLGTAALGALFIGSLAGSPLTIAAENPFGMQSLQSGYTVADKHGGEGRCGEGRCGGTKAEDKAKEGKCGGAKAGGEGKCGGAKAGDKAREGKCGEGRCGSR